MQINSSVTSCRVCRVFKKFTLYVFLYFILHASLEIIILWLIILYYIILYYIILYTFQLGGVVSYMYMYRSWSVASTSRCRGPLIFLCPNFEPKPCLQMIDTSMIFNPPPVDKVYAPVGLNPGFATGQRRWVGMETNLHSCSGLHRSVELS